MPPAERASPQSTLSTQPGAQRSLVQCAGPCLAASPCRDQLSQLELLRAGPSARPVRPVLQPRARRAARGSGLGAGLGLSSLWGERQRCHGGRCWVPGVPVLPVLGSWVSGLPAGGFPRGAGQQRGRLLSDTRGPPSCPVAPLCPSADALGRACSPSPTGCSLCCVLPLPGLPCHCTLLRCQVPCCSPGESRGVGLFLHSCWAVPVSLTMPGPWALQTTQFSVSCDSTGKGAASPGPFTSL